MVRSGPVEAAIRASISEGTVLHTPAKSAPFIVEQLGASAIVLLLGAKKAWTRIPWTALEGVPEFLRGRSWVVIGGVFDTRSDETTLDGYLKQFIKRATAGWVAAVLEQAAVVEIDRGHPSRVRLQ